MGKSLKTTNYNRGAFVERLGFHLEFTPDFRNFSLTYEPYNDDDDRVMFHFQLTTLLGLFGTGWFWFHGGWPTLLISLFFLLFPWGNTFICLPIRNRRTMDECIYGIGIFENNLVPRWGNRFKYIPLPWCYVYEGDSVWGKDGWENVSGHVESFIANQKVALISKNHRILLFKWLRIPIFKRGMNIVVHTKGDRYHLNLNENYVRDSFSRFLENTKPQRRVC